MTAERAAGERFRRDTATHLMHVLHDDGLYRHLRFRSPEHGFYWFDLVTWPGMLAFTGDGEGFLFTRIEDMFAFFRGGTQINPGYWAEKVVDGRDRLRSYSEDRFRQLVIEHIKEVADDFPGLLDAVREAVLSDEVTAFEDGARQALAFFHYTCRVDGQVAEFTFHDTWEWDLREWDWWYLWACHAIKWGIDRYDAARAITAGGTT